MRFRAREDQCSSWTFGRAGRSLQSIQAGQSYHGELAQHGVGTEQARAGLGWIDGACEVLETQEVRQAYWACAVGRRSNVRTIHTERREPGRWRWDGGHRSRAALMGSEDEKGLQPSQCVGAFHLLPMRPLPSGCRGQWESCLRIRYGLVCAEVKDRHCGHA